MLNSGKKERTQFLNKVAMIHCDLFDIAIGSGRLNGLRKGTARNVLRVLEYLLENGYKSSPASICGSPSRLSLTFNSSQVNSNQVNSNQVNSSQVNSSQINSSQINSSQINSTQNNSTLFNSEFNNNFDQINPSEHISSASSSSSNIKEFHNHYTQNQAQNNLTSYGISSVNSTSSNLSSKSQARIAQRNKLFGS